MHIPTKFKETNPDALHQFIEDHPLGTLVTSLEKTLNADHIPFYLKKLENGDKVKLQSHIAKANCLWKSCSDGQEVLVIFHGPNTYISPNLYPSKMETGKVVPTWNYSVVHVKGRIYFKHESSWVLKLLEDISSYHEMNQSKPWSVSDAPENFIEKMIRAIVGLEVIIEDMTGNFTLSQNKTLNDYIGVLNGLANSDCEVDKSVARQMQKHSARGQ